MLPELQKNVFEKIINQIQSSYGLVTYDNFGSSVAKKRKMFKIVN